MTHKNYIEGEEGQAAPEAYSHETQSRPEGCLQGPP